MSVEWSVAEKEGRRLARAPRAWCQIEAVAWRELRAAGASRWFWLYALAFVALGLGVSYVSASAGGSAGLAGLARTAAGLVNLVILFVPLLGLSAGAGAIAPERERGMLAYVLAYPLSRTELLAGKFAGLGAALTACVCLGLGVCALVLAGYGSAVAPTDVLWLAGLSVGLGLGALAVGLLISAASRRGAVATGLAVFVWLLLVFGSDLGLMAGTLALQLRIETLFALSLLNPVMVCKMWSLHAMEATLDVLGPAGLYAVDRFGDRLHGLFAGVYVAWVAVPLTLAAWVLGRRSPL